MREEKIGRWGKIGLGVLVACATVLVMRLIEVLF